MAKQTVTAKKTTVKITPKKQPKRCPTCGKYMGG